MSLPPPGPYDAAASYRNFGQQLLRMIQSGQITPERANQLKANVYEATRLGNTAQGQQAMNAAIGAARDALPMKGYDPAAMYRNISSQLSNAVKSGQMTVQQAQALQAPLFAATKLGNTAPGYAQMNSAYNRAIDAIRNASPAQPQGGLTQAQQPVMPSIATPPPPSPIPPQPPMPAFDPNAALQTFNKRAAELNASGKGLFASGMVPDEFRMYQGVLRNLQLNPNSTPEQHADILNKSMAFLNQYSGATPQPMVDPNVPYRPTGPDVFNPDGTPVVMKPKGIGGTLGATRMTPPDMPVGPVTPMPYNPINTTTEEDLRGRPGSGMGIGAFLGRPGEAIQAGGMLPRLAEMFNPKPPQPTGVDNTTFIAGDPNFRFGETPQVKAPNAQGMAMGGLLRKYYGGGMC